MELFDWRSLFESQESLYPSARLQDLIKALHQACLGCGHLIADEAGSCPMVLSACTWGTLGKRKSGPKRRSSSFPSPPGSGRKGRTRSWRRWTKSVRR